MGIKTEPATPLDAEAIASLLAEIDRFYGAGDADGEPIAAHVAAIRDALFSTLPAAHALLAWKGKRLIGMATYSFLWPAQGVTRSLYLKELFVVEDSRNLGVGHMLMQAIFRIAVGANCSRVELTADLDNSIARSFYAGIGAQSMPSKIFYRLGTIELSQSS
jgi:GNAT superfamily N-acetyltransferase